MKPTQEELNCLIHNTTYARLLCLNDVKARLYLPVTIFLAVLIVIGTIGNTVVCLVYVRRRTRASSHYFILALAALDLMTCVVGLPTEIADLLLPYTFESPWACKILRFIHSTTIIASSTILIQVAFDRYYRICQLGRQFTANKAKFLCVGAVILGFICSWPTFILFGRKTVTRRLGGNILKGTDCTTDDSMRRTIYPTIYYVFLFSLFGITVVFFAVLYSKIGLTILRRKKFTSGSVNSPPATPKGLNRAGSKKAHAPDPPSMDLSSGQEDGIGNSTASSNSSGSGESGGSNVSNSTSTTAVSNTFYGNLRRFCGYKKDIDGNHIWSSPIFTPASGKHYVNSTITLNRNSDVNCGNNSERQSTISILDHSNECITLNNSIDSTLEEYQEGNNARSNENSINRSARFGMVINNSSSDRAVSNSADNSNNSYAAITSTDRDATKFSSIQIKTTARTRIYVSSKAQNRVLPPNLQLHPELNHLQEHVQESEDEERLENAHSSQIYTQNPEQPTKRSSQRQIRVGKTTTVLFAVTLAYILSFLPYLTVMVMRSIIKDLEENLSPVGELAYKLCVKSFFINNAINPIIYSFLNQAFRQDAKQMVSRMYSRFCASSRVGRTLAPGDAV